VRYGRLIEGRLVGRSKRFFGHVEVDGAPVTAHCPNPGAMTGCLRVGGRVWLSESDDPRRKLRYTWELAEVDGAMICVHTGRANEVVAEALAAGRIAELAGWSSWRREVAYGRASRVDFLLERDGARRYLEVKTATLSRGGGLVAFPDAVTTRGTRHLAELEQMARQGHGATLLFVVARSDGARVAPADDVDPVYGAALRRAAAAGVEVLAYRCAVTPEELRLEGPVPVRYDPVHGAAQDRVDRPPRPPAAGAAARS
jgi:sugar fermentation stimulation protein A